MSKYKTFKEWQKDFQKVQKNPDDKQLIHKMIDKLENTDKALKGEIQDQIESNTLSANPMLVIKKLLKQYPESFVVIKDEDDIWFET